MTDMKPENTLYDGDNNRGMLIDLASVVRKSESKKLEAILLKDISEYTNDFTAPEILDNLGEDHEVEENAPKITVNLWKCMAFSMGKMIKNIILDYPNKLSFKKELETLSNKLSLLNPKDRMSVVEGLALLEKIGI